MRHMVLCLGVLLLAVCCTGLDPVCQGVFVSNSSTCDGGSALVSPQTASLCLSTICPQLGEDVEARIAGTQGVVGNGLAEECRVANLSGEPVHAAVCIVSTPTNCSRVTVVQGDSCGAADVPADQATVDVCAPHICSLLPEWGIAAYGVPGMTFGGRQYGCTQQPYAGAASLSVCQPQGVTPAPAALEPSHYASLPPGGEALWHLGSSTGNIEVLNRQPHSSDCARDLRLLVSVYSEGTLQATHTAYVGHGEKGAVSVAVSANMTDIALTNQDSCSVNATVYSLGVHTKSDRNDTVLIVMLVCVVVLACGFAVAMWHFFWRRRDDANPEKQRLRSGSIQQGS